MCALNLTCEVAQTMLNLYNEHVLPDSIRQDKTWARQLYAVSLLYSVMLQRRKYGACGWSTSFDLDFTDWNTCTGYIKNICDQARDSPEFSDPANMIKVTRALTVLVDLFERGKLCFVDSGCLGTLYESPCTNRTLQTHVAETCSHFSS